MHLYALARKFSRSSADADELSDHSQSINIAFRIEKEFGEAT
jgi:hypothetical protein